ncbi:ribonuclease P Rpr2/Rpp21/SNM1 subunit [Aspergillus undulatus]|uniref:ribonuclease P Rpr2/Rpp21/SNM1 subunit n=1 Tax=Aspergillus undulatus TaxID=1810928 RepID=UPI003CCD3DB7
MAKAAKAKGKKGSGGGMNSHVRARINYLFKAAAHLQSAATSRKSLEAAAKNREDEDEVMADLAHPLPTTSATKSAAQTHAEYHPQLARTCISQMRGVSQKSQLRLPVEQKRSFCKRCDTLLVLGTNCTQETRNPSRGARKPWAEIRIVRCNICGTEKRFPQTYKRSRKLAERKEDKTEELP